MKVRNINTNISYRAKLADDVRHDVERQGLMIWRRKGVTSKEFRTYQKNMALIEEKFPDGEVCYDENNKYKLVLKHNGKKTIPLIENHSPFLIQSIAGALSTTARNISRYLADE